MRGDPRTFSLRNKHLSGPRTCGVIHDAAETTRVPGGGPHTCGGDPQYIQVCEMVLTRGPRTCGDR